MKKKHMVGLLLLCSLLLVVPNLAFSRPVSQDARKVADFIARSSVRTIYKNLRAEGIPWKRIRDEHIPKMLSKSLKSIRRDFSREVVLSEFLPTLINSYYSEVDKINRENRTTCFERTFIVRTIVPFIRECEVTLGPWKISISQVVDLVLDISYPYTVCSTGCKEWVKNEFSSAFNYSLPESRFGKICSE